MCIRSTVRPDKQFLPMLTEDDLREPRFWQAASVEDLRQRHDAETLRRIVRALGLRPESRTANACARAIVAHGRKAAEPSVPWIEVRRETAYGHTVELSHAVRVF